MRYVLVILMVLLCCYTLDVTAQQEYIATVNIIFLGAFGQPLVDYAGFRAFGQTLVERLEVNLEANHVDLFFVDNENLGPRSNVNIVIAQNARDEKSSEIYLGPATPISLDKSPILTSQFDFAEDSLADIFSIPVSPDQPEVQEAILNLATALSLYSIRQCDLALPYFQVAIEKVRLLREYSDITLPYINYYQGNCALIEGNYTTAIEFFQNALFSQEKMNLGSAINLAWTYLQNGQVETAFALISQAIQLEANPRKQAILFAHRSQLYALRFDYDYAIADMNAAIEIDPDNPELYVLRGQMVLLTYEWDAVLADYNRALELDPDYADAYFYRGVLFYTQGPREQALADFERYVELAPEGEHAEEAAKYIESIKVELEALDQ